MMLPALGKTDAHDAGGFGEKRGGCGVNARPLTLMMLRALGKTPSSFGEKRGGSGANARRLTLMMLPALGKTPSS